MFKFSYKYPWNGLLFFDGEGDGGGGGGGSGTGTPAPQGANNQGTGTPAPRRDPPAQSPQNRRDWTIEDYERELAETRAEAAGRRIKNQDMAAELARANEAKEKAERELTEAKQSQAKADAARLGKIRSRAIETELRAQAQAAGLRDLDLLALVDKKSIKFSEDDETIEGVTEAIAAFKERKPEYFSAPGGGGGNTNQNANGGGAGGGQNNGGAGGRQTGAGDAPPPTGGSPTNVRTLSKEDAGKARTAARNLLLRA